MAATSWDTAPHGGPCSGAVADGGLGARAGGLLRNGIKAGLLAAAAYAAKSAAGAVQVARGEGAAVGDGLLAQVRWT